MPEIKSLAEFREQLEKILCEHRVDRSEENNINYLMMEVRICQLALDYADGFYLSASAMKHVG